MAKPYNAVHIRPSNREENAWFGDPVPFYWNGTYHLFYVWDQGHLVLPRVCHVWGHFTSRDLVHWEEQPMAIEPGDEASCGSGSVFETNGLFHMYYLGRYFRTNGVMSETMCHATSTDLITWNKDPANPFSKPDLSRYSVKDWRDGFPFWNPEAGEYWMLLTASLKDGPEGRRGCIALLASKDLNKWEVRDPYWAPYLGRHLECPDLFEWNGWWYLVFSGGYGHTGGTLYRRAHSLNGPWESTPVDTFDGPYLYACKTAGDQNRRMLFGWVGTREGDRDIGRVQWGGHGTVRELVQDPDGTLWAKCPPERLELGEPLPAPRFVSALGTWHVTESMAASDPDRGLAYVTAPVPMNVLVRFRFTPGARTERFGAFLRTDPELRGGYQLCIEPHKQRFQVFSFGQEGAQRPQPFRRTMPCNPDGRFDITIFFSDSILEVFINDRSALALRLYDHQGSHLGLYVEDGAGTFSDVAVRQLPAEVW